jgi:hypothetical protein
MSTKYIGTYVLHGGYCIIIIIIYVHHGYNGFPSNGLQLYIISINLKHSWKIANLAKN